MSALRDKGGEIWRRLPRLYSVTITFADADGRLNPVRKTGLPSKRMARTAAIAADAMDVTIRVTWGDGSTTLHTLCGLPYHDVAAVEEVLEQKLADYLDDEGATDDQGLPLGWTDVQVVRGGAD